MANRITSATAGNGTPANLSIASHVMAESCWLYMRMWLCVLSWLFNDAVSIETVYFRMTKWLMNVEQMAWELAGETKAPGENAIQCHFVYHESHMTLHRNQAISAVTQRLTAWILARHIYVHVYIYIYIYMRCLQKVPAMTEQSGSTFVTLGVEWPYNPTVSYGSNSVPSRSDVPLFFVISFAMACVVLSRSVWIR
jgi:hypothetical protein